MFLVFLCWLPSWAAASWHKFFLEQIIYSLTISVRNWWYTIFLLWLFRLVLSLSKYFLQCFSIFWISSTFQRFLMNLSYRHVPSDSGEQPQALEPLMMYFRNPWSFYFYPFRLSICPHWDLRLPIMPLLVFE